MSDVIMELANEANDKAAEIARLKADNAKLREQVERLQPKDCEGNVLDIADTVNMLRSEYDGDHEWDDVVTELVLTKWGGDRWIVRGSKGEAWACDCTKTGYDEDAYEASDDVEPFSEPTLLEVENAKLREERDMYRDLVGCMVHPDIPDQLAAENAELRELCADMLHDAMENICSKAHWCDEKSWQTCNDEECGNRLYVEMARELEVVE